MTRKRDELTLESGKSRGFPFLYYHVQEPWREMTAEEIGEGFTEADGLCDNPSKIFWGRKDVKRYTRKIFCREVGIIRLGDLRDS